MIVDADFRIRRDDFELQFRGSVARGETVALLGPNGSGKTTTLNALAGLLAVDEGRISIGDRVVDDVDANVLVHANRRPVSIVFQDHLLFPHMDARDNVAFTLRTRGLRRTEARRRAQTWLSRFDLEGLARQRPGQLSGGQAQRVALARALAAEPDLLLLDEPLAALDVSTRVVVRRELRRILTDFDGATIVVTHDPLDAIALASRVIVLENGRISQAGAIAELTARPRSQFVAELVGLNLFTGIADHASIAIDGTDRAIHAAESSDGEVFVLIHPHAVSLHRLEPAGSPRNRWLTRIESFDLLGDKVRVRTTDEPGLVAEITTDAIADLDLHEGDPVWVAVKATEVTVYPR